jgi:hypothetical protein
MSPVGASEEALMTPARRLFGLQSACSLKGLRAGGGREQSLEAHHLRRL